MESNTYDIHVILIISMLSLQLLSFNLWPRVALSLLLNDVLTFVYWLRPLANEFCCRFFNILILNIRFYKYQKIKIHEINLKNSFRNSFYFSTDFLVFSLLYYDYKLNWIFNVFYFRSRHGVYEVTRLYYDIFKLLRMKILTTYSIIFTFSFTFYVPIN